MLADRRTERAKSNDGFTVVGVGLDPILDDRIELAFIGGILAYQAAVKTSGPILSVDLHVVIREIAGPYGLGVSA